MIGSQYIHPTSKTNDVEESSSDFENSDGEEEDTVGLKNNNSKNLGTLLHVFKVISNFIISIPCLYLKNCC